MARMRARPRTPGWSPLEIPWHTAWWPAGPRFRARNLADLSSISVADDESGNGHDGATGANAPVYHAASSLLGGQPTWQSTVGGATQRILASFSALTQPTNIFVVFALTSLTQGTLQVVWDGAGTSNRHGLFTYTPLTPDGWWLYGGGGTVVGGTADTNPHAVLADYNGLNSQFFVDDPVVPLLGPADAGSNTLTGLMWAAQFDATAPANVTLGFLGIINRELTQGERVRLFRWAKRLYRTT